MNILNLAQINSLFNFIESDLIDTTRRDTSEFNISNINSKKSFCIILLTILILCLNYYYHTNIKIDDILDIQKPSFLHNNKFLYDFPKTYSIDLGKLHRLYKYQEFQSHLKNLNIVNDYLNKKNSSNRIESHDNHIDNHSSLVIKNKPNLVIYTANHPIINYLQNNPTPSNIIWERMVLNGLYPDSGERARLIVKESLKTEIMNSPAILTPSKLEVDNDYIKNYNFLVLKK